MENNQESFGKYHVVSLSSNICEDDYEHGEGKSTGCGYQNQPVGQTFNSFNDMLAHLASYYGLPSNPVDYEHERGELRTSKTVANHSEAQNGGWFEPTTDEFQAWAAGKMKLYLENFQVRYIRCS
jgi:hypothetical protein